MSVIIETTLGDITVDLYLKERPNACLNFLKLCKIKYYNLCLFYKIERNFIAQTGDPTGTGRGGESVFSHLYGDQAKYFDSEFKPRLKHDKLGTISMVNNGNNMNGSQFFLTLGENIAYLDEVHTVFGEVVEGSDVLLKLNESICDGDNRPYQDIRITHTVVLHDPYDDPKGLEIPDASPEPTREQLESGYIAADEEIDDNKGKSAEEIEEKIKESEAKARATILEMVGDIPDADVKPPENVLFVCKLNPVTTSEDLEVIFSRFGTIVSCEVIKDKKTAESLQYAFIEFEKEEDCENAYFKMDNVLIDDRRIHVDFSQSVSKLNWDKDGKFSHSKSSRQNVVLKTNEKGTDGYDLIFDMNDDKNEIINDKKAQKHRHQSSEDKHLYSKYKKFDRERHRSRSPAVKVRKNENDKKYSCDPPRYTDTKSNRNYPSKSSRYEHNSYQRNKSRDYDRPIKENSKHFLERTSRNYKDSERSRKSSEGYFSKYSETSRNRHKYSSISPDRQRGRSYDKQRLRSPSYEGSSRTKYSDKFDHHADAEYRRDKKCKSSHRDNTRSRVELSPHQKTKNTPEKIPYNSKLLKKSRKVSRSSSTSSSSSSSVAKRRPKKPNTSSSESDSSSSDSSSDEKSKKKKVKFSNKKLSGNVLHDKQKKKKCKYSS